MVTITSIMGISMMIITRLGDSNCLSFSLAMITMSISTVMRISMVISWFSLSLSLSMISMIAISTISMMAMVVSWLSNSNSFSLSLSLSMILSRFSISFSYCFWFSLPFAIISMMAISTIAMMAISMIVSWFSDSCT